jgi:hypothetical protein
MVLATKWLYEDCRKSKYTMKEKEVITFSGRLEGMDRAQITMPSQCC